MRNALHAMMFSVAALIASMIIGDMVVSLLTIAVSVLKVAHAYDVHRRAALRPNLYPYRLQILR